MKKLLLSFLAVMLLAVLMTGIGYAEDFDPVEPIDRAVDFEGGFFDFANAPEIQPGVFYHILPEYENRAAGYRLINLPESGTYYIYFRNLSGAKNNNYIEFSLANKYDKEIIKFDIHGNTEIIHQPYIYSVDLESGIYYFRNDGSYFPEWFHDEAFFAVCSPSQHAGDLSEEVIVQEPTCTEPGYKAQHCLLCGAEVNRTEIPALGHTPGETVVVEEPTCTEPGRRATLCAVCGEELESEVIPAHGHTPGEEVTLAEPTCISEGVKAVLCEECGQVLSRETLPMVDHKPGQFIQVLAPTCTTKGRNEQHCEVCNALLASEEVEPYGHVPGVWEDLVPVTATTDGLRVQRCVVCGETLNSETIKAPQGN